MKKQGRGNWVFGLRLVGLWVEIGGFMGCLWCCWVCGLFMLALRLVVVKFLWDVVVVGFCI